MKKVFVIEPDYPGVEGYDFKVDIEFETKEDAEKYAKEKSLGKGYYTIDEIIPHSKLFFIDVMARIPYGVKFRFELQDGKYKDVSISDSKTPSIDSLYSYWMLHGHYLPYLRPMSSMTEGERDEVEEMSHGWLYVNEDGEIFPMGQFTDSGEFEDAILPTLDWLNKNYFDYRGLIPMGLALEAPENMYKTE
jgi:hypothetical protein